MKVAVAFKVVPDDEDIAVNADRTLDFRRAKPVVSTYDLNAIEFAATAFPGAEVVALTVGDESVEDSKLKKNVLARGVDRLYAVVGDDYAAADARVTACALAAAIRRIGDVDVVVFGDGSADRYAQQVNAQVAVELGVPSITCVVEARAEGDAVRATRVLETVRETVEAAFPCVLSVLPEAALPRICTMKEILAAGKKPASVLDLGDAGAVPAATETIEVLAPLPAVRANVVLDASRDGAVEQFAAALRQAIQ